MEAATAIADIEAVLSHQPPYGGTAGVSEVSTMIKACIERWAPTGSSYRRMADAVDPLPVKYSHTDVRLRGVLVTLLRDYKAGMIRTFAELVHASVFDDLIGQAEQFLEGDYLLPAAVVLGAALEEHLRQLATKNGVALQIPDGRGVPRPRMASTLNDDLHKQLVYSQPEWRQIQVWIDIRNNAAHGKAEFKETSREDIKRMIDHVRDFIRRHPA